MGHGWKWQRVRGERVSQEVNSLEELIAAGTSELQRLADAGNTVAQYWLRLIQYQPTTTWKLNVLGEMRVALMSHKSAEAKLVYKVMWPDNQETKIDEHSDEYPGR